MGTNYLFNPFIRKYEQLQIPLVENIYEDKHFSTFYQSFSKAYDQNVDVSFYKSHLSTQDKVLEIGTGDGRVFIPLYEAGIDIYGIEPYPQMLASMDLKYLEYIFPIGLETIETIHVKEFTKIIIPATTISLFSFEEFEQFLMKVRELLAEGGAIIFDCLNDNFLNSQGGRLQMKVLGNDTYYFANKIVDNKILLNILVNYDNEQKLGYSIKYLYTFEKLSLLAEQHRYSIQRLEEDDYVYFVEMRKNE